jgi:predicted acyl esterase
MVTYSLSKRFFVVLLTLGLSMVNHTPSKADGPVVMKPAYRVRVERNIQIPTRDGTKLSADLIRPDADGKFPAIIE